MSYQPGCLLPSGCLSVGGVVCYPPGAVAVCVCVERAVLAVQFLRNGAVRLTFKEAALCTTVLERGVSFRRNPLHLARADSGPPLVYLRDCPVEVPDSVVKKFFQSFGEVHSISQSAHPQFPGLQDGNRQLRVTITKDIPGDV